MSEESEWLTWNSNKQSRRTPKGQVSSFLRSQEGCSPTGIRRQEEHNDQGRQGIGHIRSLNHFSPIHVHPTFNKVAGDVLSIPWLSLFLIYFHYWCISLLECFSQTVFSAISVPLLSSSQLELTLTTSSFGLP